MTTQTNQRSYSVLDDISSLWVKAAEKIKAAHCPIPVWITCADDSGKYSLGYTKRNGVWAIFTAEEFEEGDIEFKNLARDGRADRKVYAVMHLVKLLEQIAEEKIKFIAVAEASKEKLSDIVDLGIDRLL